HRLQTTDHYGSRWLQMLQSCEIKRERRQDRKQREQQQEQPLRRQVMCGGDLPGRIQHNPEKRRAPRGVQKHSPAVVAGKDAVSANVVKSKRKRGEQRSDYADSVQLEAA